MTAFLRFLLLSPLVLLLGLTITACDSGGSTDEDDGPDLSDAFTLTVKDAQGNTVKTIQSYSFFSTLADSTGAISYNQFFSDQRSQNLSGNRSFVGSAFRLSDRPAVGTYPASSDNDRYQSGEAFLISFTAVEASGGSTYYLVQGGDVGITRSESSRVEGTLSLEAEATTVAADGTTQSQQTVTVTGSFQASSIGAFSN